MLNKIPNLIVLSMTILSVWAFFSPSNKDHLNSVVNDLTQVASDYTVLHNTIKDFRGQETAFNTIDIYERTVETNLRNTPSAASRRKPQFEQVHKRVEVLTWLERLYAFSNQLPLALEEKVISKDAEEIERGRVWCNGLFEGHIPIWRGVMTAHE
ncbi:hypothetical protein BJX96DRAFT_175579 [Aspergillus floccosus]